MILSSGNHTRLAADPQPWRSPIDGSRFPDKLPGDMLDWAPRAELGGPLSNPANPILVEFRRPFGGVRPTTRERVERYLRYCVDPDASSEDDPSWTQEQRDHARAVLSRLGALL